MKFLASLGILLLFGGQALADPITLHIDYAYYNPVSLVLKDQHLLEDALGDDVKVQWILSAGSNKALEYLNARSLDFGSTAGSAALLARANGNPIKVIYVYSKPEWTALVTQPNSGIHSVADLKGKRVAATRGTDPGIFLLRALAEAGIDEHDVKIIPLQHADGRLSLDSGSVDAWAGLDPYMAQAQLENHDVLFYRKPEFNTYGVLDVREGFLRDHPDLTEKVIRAYEKARHWALDHPAELQQLLVNIVKLSPGVAALQLQRTDLSNPIVGDGPKQSIAGAGAVLKASGIVAADADLDKIESDLLDTRYSTLLAQR